MSNEEKTPYEKILCLFFITNRRDYLTRYRHLFAEKWSHVHIFALRHVMVAGRRVCGSTVGT